MARSLAATSIAIAMVTVLQGFGASHAQERDSEFYQNFMPARVAEAFLLNTDFVAIGEFGAPVEIGHDPISLLESREVDLDFSVRTVYKGNVRPGTVVKIRLRNGMLVYPGETISRYDKRIRLFDEVRKRLADGAAAESEAVQEELDTGRIPFEEARRRFREIDVRSGSLIAESQAVRRIQRRPIYSHGRTVYEMGVAIRPDTLFLLAVNSIDGNLKYYTLGELGGIWWDDAADDIRLEIERLQETSRSFQF